MKLRLKVPVARKTLLVDQIKRSKNMGPASKRFPQIMRFGPGSLDEQIRQRTHFTPTGGRVPWTEASYAASRSTFNVVDELEYVMWDAARGGPGSITRATAFSASVGVDDRVVRAKSAELGNQIVSTADYFGFVTGDFQERTAPAPAKAVKPTKTGKGEFPFNRAMYWFLKLQFGYTADAADLQSGMTVPPKNLGLNPVMMARMGILALNWIMKGVPTEA